MFLYRNKKHIAFGFMAALASCAAPAPAFAKDVTGTITEVVCKISDVYDVRDKQAVFYECHMVVTYSPDKAFYAEVVGRRQYRLGEAVVLTLKRNGDWNVQPLSEWRPFR